MQLWTGSRLSESKKNEEEGKYNESLKHRGLRFEACLEQSFSQQALTHADGTAYECSDCFEKHREVRKVDAVLQGKFSTLGPYIFFDVVRQQQGAIDRKDDTEISFPLELDL